jgi:hypothetical protein
VTTTIRVLDLGESSALRDRSCCSVSAHDADRDASDLDRRIDRGLAASTSSEAAKLTIGATSASDAVRAAEPLEVTATSKKKKIRTSMCDPVGSTVAL